MNKTIFISKENPFMFDLTGNSSKWINRAAILRAHSIEIEMEQIATL